MGALSAAMKYVHQEERSERFWSHEIVRSRHARLVPRSRNRPRM